jgi:hypothetical protein
LLILVEVVFSIAPFSGDKVVFKVEELIEALSTNYDL